MPGPGAAVILNLRDDRSVYAGGGVEDDGRRERRSCEEDEALAVLGVGVEDDGEK